MEPRDLEDFIKWLENSDLTPEQKLQLLVSMRGELLTDMNSLLKEIEETRSSILRSKRLLEELKEEKREVKKQWFKFWH